MIYIGFDMQLEDLKNKLDQDGVVIIENVFQPQLIDSLRFELETAIEEDRVNWPEVFDAGMVHNCMIRGESMRALLDNANLNYFIKNLFTPHCIIYAYQSSSLSPGSGNYGSRIHVDCPRWIADYTTNIGVIIALNDFTLENGATYYLAGSHRSSTIPEENSFYEGAKRLVCKSGALVIFNARLVHAAGTNLTQFTRHALTINLCRPFMRQRFDFPRLMTQEQIDSLGKDGQRLIGMNVRMPTSLEEFYLPEEERFYKPGQE